MSMALALWIVSKIEEVQDEIKEAREKRAYEKQDPTTRKIGNDTAQDDRTVKHH